jgi:DNA modification methylase
MKKMLDVNAIYPFDARAGLKLLPEASIDCCVTSPPYYMLRDYGIDNQIGLEDTPEAYVARLAEVFTEVYRAMKRTGTLWIVIGDSRNGSGKNGGNDYKTEWKQRTNAAKS